MRVRPEGEPAALPGVRERAMRRRLPNLLTALSLVLCVAVVVFWARSYERAELFRIVGRHRGSLLVTCRGDFKVYRSDYIDGGDWRPRFAYETERPRDR